MKTDNKMLAIQINIKHIIYYHKFVPFIFTVNLAPRGVAVQITTYSIFTANLAIEGPANNNWDDGCSATDVEQTYAWWGLQLPAVAHMTNILIYYRRNSMLLSIASTDLKCKA